MKIEKLRSKLKKAFNRVMGVLLPVATLFVSCGTNALVVHAAESNVITITSLKDKSTDKHTETEFHDLNVNVPDGSELVGLVATSYVSSGGESVHCSDDLAFYIVKNGKALNLKKSGVSYSYNITTTYDGNSNMKAETGEVWYIPYKSYANNVKNTPITFSISSKIKIFHSLDEFNKYVSTGTGDYDIIKPDELEKGWYLKNVSYKVTADDSPSSEAGADATYIHFSWDIDNLQDGDLLEIKTKSYYKKILGEQLSGFYDFITKSDGVSAYEGKYSFSQYEATKAWFNSLENKPLVFKEYDTTDYYLRPYRQGQYGGWVHIKMGRSTPTSSPYIEDIEYGDFDDDNNWTVDEDLTDKNGGHHGVDQGGGYIPPDQSDNPFTGTNIAGIFSYFYDFMKQIPAMLGDLPALVGNIISFLPKPIIAFIGIGVIVAIILRIVGR